MVCGGPNIWPLPTIKTNISSQSLTFKSNLIKFNAVSQFDGAKNLLEQAYDVFLHDLKNLENHRDENANGVGSNGGSGGAGPGSDSNGNAPGNDLANDQRNAGAPSETRNGDGDATVRDRDNNGNGNGKFHNADKICDIKNIHIISEITHVPEIYLQLDTDESYELNITSK